MDPGFHNFHKGGWWCWWWEGRGSVLTTSSTNPIAISLYEAGSTREVACEFTPTNTHYIICATFLVLKIASHLYLHDFAPTITPYV